MIEPDSRASWTRLSLLVLLGTIGAVGMWSIVVTLPAVQAEFGVDRAAAALPYTLTMLGVAAGSIVMGWSADRLGIARTVAIGGSMLGLGYAGAAFAHSLWQYALLHGALIGLLGTAATFGPLMTEASQWFVRRRGLAVSICASGNYFAGTFWPSVVAHFTRTNGWRATELGIGLFCAATMLPLSLLLRGPRPMAEPPRAAIVRGGRADALGFAPTTLMLMLIFAGIACCVAMAMPQVHIVAYCGDLGYGASQGATMLSVMLGAGVISRIGSGWVADRIGGVPTLLLGSLLQALSLVFYLQFNGLAQLYLISGLFGLVQGGLIPMYAVIVRECFPAKEAGMRFGFVLMASVAGMALAGWMSGAIYDMTGSYRAAFANGVLWNLFNVAIAALLLVRQRSRVAFA